MTARRLVERFPFSLHAGRLLLVEGGKERANKKRRGSANTSGIHSCKAMVRLAGWFGFIVITAAYASVPACAQNFDDALQVYAVKVVRTAPQSKEPLVSSGISLGRGAV